MRGVSTRTGARADGGGVRGGDGAGASGSGGTAARPRRGVRAMPGHLKGAPSNTVQTVAWGSDFVGDARE